MKHVVLLLQTHPDTQVGEVSNEKLLNISNLPISDLDMQLTHSELNRSISSSVLV